jgi:hypothetical protein
MLKGLRLDLLLIHKEIVLFCFNVQSHLLLGVPKKIHGKHQSGQIIKPGIWL